jgi:hypothetical protein
MKTVINSSVQHDKARGKIGAGSSQMQLYLEFKLHFCRIVIHHFIFTDEFADLVGNCHMFTKRTP